jgi:hypothetical protein
LGDERAQRAALEALQAELAELRRTDDSHALEEARQGLAARRAEAQDARDEAARALRVEQARMRGALARRAERFTPTSGGWVPALVVALLCAGLASGLVAHTFEALWPLAGALASMVAFGRFGWRQGQRAWAEQRARQELPGD